MTMRRRTPDLSLCQQIRPVIQMHENRNRIHSDPAPSSRNHVPRTYEQICHPHHRLVGILMAVLDGITPT